MGSLFFLTLKRLLRCCWRDLQAHFFSNLYTVGENKFLLLKNSQLVSISISRAKNWLRPRKYGSPELYPSNFDFYEFLSSFGQFSDFLLFSHLRLIFTPEHFRQFWSIIKSKNTKVSVLHLLMYRVVRRTGACRRTRRPPVFSCPPPSPAHECLSPRPSPSLWDPMENPAESTEMCN